MRNAAHPSNPSLLLPLMFLLAFLAPLQASAGHAVVHDWPNLPESLILGQVTGVGVDGDDNVFLFRRADRMLRPGKGDDDLGAALFLSTFRQTQPGEKILHDCVLKLDGQSGGLRDAWGSHMYLFPHGLTVDAANNVWLTDTQLHQVFKCDREGNVLMTLGEEGKPGADGTHFNAPTDVAVAADGTFYVADGYGNSRVAKFDKEGKYLLEWGSPGGGPGQFSNPHGISLDSIGNVYVADRYNARIQVFDAAGKFLAEWKSEELGRPWSICIRNESAYIVDGGDQDPKTAPRSRLIVCDLTGKVLEKWGQYGNRDGQMVFPHDLAVDSQGNIYAGEVHYGMRIQKFIPSNQGE
ncbi:MAG: 6-bladed beta-propeller [Candidatus Hydrogenedentes bacterium]|nr:6-bladed beta-propeller [Candidatus Hydrogenedentota bacterium]